MLKNINFKQKKKKRNENEGIFAILIQTKCKETKTQGYGNRGQVYFHSLKIDNY